MLLTPRQLEKKVSAKTAPAIAHYSTVTASCNTVTVHYHIVISHFIAVGDDLMMLLLTSILLLLNITLVMFIVLIMLLLPVTLLLLYYCKILMLEECLG